MKTITLDDACFQAAVHLEGANLQGASLEDACLHCAHLEQAILFDAHLERINLSGGHLEQADVNLAHLEQADLSHAQLEQADLSYAHLEGVSLEGAQLGGTSLRGAFFDNATRLNSIHLTSKKFGVASVADIHWCDVNVAVLSWSDIDKLGDEYLASKGKWADGAAKSKTLQVEEHHAALRANRQIAIVLRNQGLNEEADHFAYRAQLLERVLWRQQRRLLKFIFSWVLFLLAGYGYRPLRSILIYLLMIAAFAVGYYEVTHFLHAQPYPLAWYEALILSISAFHGRGFFQPVQSLGNPVAILASIEAVFGLLIEISFIATFTQRFFGK